METLAAETLPPGLRTEWTGIAYQQKAAGSTAGIVFALAVVFVFLVLAAQYRKPGPAAGDHPDRADVPARGDGRREPARAWTTMC